MKAKALTVREPWAAVIAAGWKTVENRGWGTHHRGRLFIHAGLQAPTPSDIDHAKWLAQTVELPPFRPGLVVCSVELVDVCTPVDCRCKSRWGERGTWHWQLRNPVVIQQDWPVRGQLGLWDLHIQQEVS